MSVETTPDSSYVEPPRHIRHVVSIENDIALMLRSGIDQTAASGLVRLLQARQLQGQKELPTDVIAVMQAMQDENAAKGLPNTYEALDEKLSEKYPEALNPDESSASGADVSNLPPVA